MRRKLPIGGLAGMLAVLLSLNPAAAVEDHKAEAVKEALSAVESGKQGQAAAAGEHVRAAKLHAEAAEHEKANPHLGAAIKDLEAAIEHSQKGRAELAGESARQALTHLKAAEKAF